jgi:Holliday junction resolvase-like predicted endonuclease
VLEATHYRRQGDRGEASAIEWLTRAGANVLVPLFHSPDYDLVAELGGRLLRVQVKTSTFTQRRAYVVSLATRGGNRSWTGTVKRFDAGRADFLFVLVADGRRWFIPASAVGGGTVIHVGSTKYGEFEVDRGAPLASAETMPRKPPA